MALTEAPKLCILNNLSGLIDIVTGVSSSAGAADAFKPVVLDANGALDSSLANFEVVQPGSSTSSFQVVAADFTINTTSGKDAPDTAQLGAVMGNVFGTDLTKTGNYIFGVQGAYSISGTNAARFGKGAVLAQIADGTTSADAAVLAILDGDSALTTALAAFGVKQNNSVPNSGFSYGLDLYGPAHDGFNPIVFLQSDIRGQNQGLLKNKDSNGAWSLTVPTTAPADSSLGDNELSFWIDETNNRIMFKAKESDTTIDVGSAVPDLPNDATLFLDGTGNFSLPAGGGGSTGDNIITTPILATHTTNFKGFSVNLFAAASQVQATGAAFKLQFDVYAGGSVIIAAAAVRRTLPGSIVFIDTTPK